MAILTDTRGTRLSFFGRFTDEISRDVLTPDEFRVDLEGAPLQPPPAASYKQDGYFVFQNLKASASAYELRFDGPRYQQRSFLQALPTVDPVELTYGAEDEIYLAITSVQVALKRIGFDAIPFLPRISAASQVRGEGGFTTTLTENLEGVAVATADLNDVTGLAVGQLLRIIRSHGLLAKPGPYYPFPPATTVLAFKVVSDLPGKAPIARAAARIKKVNAIALTGTLVDGVELENVTLASPPPAPVLIFGPERDTITASDARGQSVFYFPGQWPITAVEIDLTATGYLPTTAILTSTPGQRTFATIELTPA